MHLVRRIILLLLSSLLNNVLGEYVIGVSLDDRYRVTMSEKLPGAIVSMNGQTIKELPHGFGSVGYVLREGSILVLLNYERYSADFVTILWHDNTISKIPIAVASMFIDPSSQRGEMNTFKKRDPLVALGTSAKGDDCIYIIDPESFRGIRCVAPQKAIRAIHLDEDPLARDCLLKTALLFFDALPQKQIVSPSDWTRDEPLFWQMTGALRLVTKYRAHPEIARKMRTIAESPYVDSFLSENQGTNELTVKFPVRAALAAELNKVQLLEIVKTISIPEATQLQKIILDEITPTTTNTLLEIKDVAGLSRRCRLSLSGLIKGHRLSMYGIAESKDGGSRRVELLR
jgi:hypothetical protein